MRTKSITIPKKLTDLPPDSGSLLIPLWMYELNPEAIHCSGDGSVVCCWTSRGIVLDVYYDGTVVAVGPDPSMELPERRAFCEVRLRDRPWLEAFVRHGWNQTEFPPLGGCCASCWCGGLDYPHHAEDAGCLREVVPAPMVVGGRWLVLGDEGGPITDFTLKQQRGYSKHDCGCWSRPRGGGSDNSLHEDGKDPY